MLRVILFLFSFATLVVNAQTFQVVEVEISCESKSIDGLNSKAADFSPFVNNGNFYFTSSREYDLMNLGENNWSKLNRLNIFSAKIKGDISENIKLKNIALVSQKLITENHTGPLCLSVTGDTLFFTQVQAVSGKLRKSKEKLRPQLFMTIRLGNDWNPPIALPFNDEDYSFGHPYYDSKSRRLYFASDMDGKGGKDIFYSEIKQSQWREPVNVEEINSKDDELYPCIVDNFIFYASNKAGGYGGLDIYWKNLTDKMQASKQAEGLNGPEDDFGIYVFPGMAKGYYSSNQEGNDDIYYFDMTKVIKVKNKLDGQFSYRNIDGSPSSLQVMIVDENDELLFETTTDENGRFNFENIDYDGNYQIRAKTEEDLVLSIFDKDGNIVSDLVTDEKGSYVYKKLAYDAGGTLSLIPEDMIDMQLNQGHLSGQFVFENLPGEYPDGLKVILTDEDGNMKFTSFTDERGNFDFKQLDMEENYLLKLPDNTDDLVLLIFDQKGNVVAQLKANEDGQFNYRKLKTSYSNTLQTIQLDEEPFLMEAQTISGYFEYKNLKNQFGDGLTIQAYSQDGFLLEETLTDKGGNFRFRNLPIQSNLLFKVKETDETLALDEFTLFIFDRDGKKIAQLRRGQNDYFNYKPLGFESQNDLTTVDNPSLEFSLNTNKDVVVLYFDSNQSSVKNSDMGKLKDLLKKLKSNKGLSVEVNAYADARNSVEYNLNLSSKRGDWIVRYLVRNGINKDRFIVNAYGESGLVSQDNDALNRRAEIIVY